MTLEEYFKLPRQPFPKAATNNALLRTAGLEPGDDVLQPSGPE